MMTSTRFLNSSVAVLTLFVGLVAATLNLPAQRQFPHLFTLDSRSADTLFTPDATSPLHRYRITAWGTYSMWEDTVNSSVDPVWIYSFPDEEWAKPEWRLFPEGFPIYVGDSRMFDSHGLRVNNAPFPQTPLNDEHRYEMIIGGTGEPVSTAIVDWNLRGLVKRDAHENNSGTLYVLVEELPLIDLDLCAVDSSQFPSVRVSLTVSRDSLREDALLQNLVLVENGLPVRIDSIDCGERTRPVSVGLVVDRSGSMTEEWGSSTRMTQVRSAAHKFVDRLEPTDEGALYTFGTNVRLDQSWTHRFADLHAAIDRIVPAGYTAMNDAVSEALLGSASRPDTYRKAVVLLSDGEDNISRITSISEVIDLAKRLDIPVFTIGLLLDTDDSLRALSTETGGRHFSVRDPGSIDSVFSSIAELLFEKGCCNVWYTSPRPARDGTMRLVEAAIVIDDESAAAVTGEYRAPTGTSSVRDHGRATDISVSLFPNPSADKVEVVVHGGNEGGSVFVEVYSAVGERVLEPLELQSVAGGKFGTISLHGLPDGVYALRVWREGGSTLQLVRKIE